MACNAGEAATARSRSRNVSVFPLQMRKPSARVRARLIDIWFERALEDRTAWLWMTPVEPRFDTLRGDPRFREIVGRHGLRSDP